MNERYIKWYTPWLSHEFEMLGYAGCFSVISSEAEWAGNDRLLIQEISRLRLRLRSK
jgi:hypothetical protein